jgi:hypothetical protein
MPNPQRLPQPITQVVSLSHHPYQRMRPHLLAAALRHDRPAEPFPLVDYRLAPLARCRIRRDRVTIEINH